jgi:hypothetical protein
MEKSKQNGNDKNVYWTYSSNLAKKKKTMKLERLDLKAVLELQMLLCKIFSESKKILHSISILHRLEHYFSAYISTYFFFSLILFSFVWQIQCQYE